MVIKSRPCLLNPLRITGGKFFMRNIINAKNFGNDIRNCKDVRTNNEIITNRNNPQNIKSYLITGIGKGNASSIKTNTAHELFTDLPKPMGGNDESPQPVEHLLAALVGCTQATAVFVGRSMKPRLQVEKIEFIDIHGFRDQRGALHLPIEETPPVPARLQSISGRIKVHINKRYHKKHPITDRQFTLLKEQTELRCPIANMLHASGCQIDIEWILSREEIP